MNSSWKQNFRRKAFLKPGTWNLNVELRTMNETQGTQQTQTTIIVPAYNEESGLPVVLEKLFRIINEGSEASPGTSDPGHRTYEVIIVDDGSTDRTSEVASRFPCRVIRHEKNLGKGEAESNEAQTKGGPDRI